MVNINVGSSYNTILRNSKGINMHNAGNEIKTMLNVSPDQLLFAVFTQQEPPELAMLYDNMKPTCVLSPDFIE